MSPTDQSPAHRFGLRLPARISESQAELVSYLQRQGHVSDAMLEACLAEQEITGEKLGLILTRNGFITRKTLIEAILRLNPTGIVGEQQYTSRIPADILLRTKTMVVAETQEKIFLATL